MDLPVSQFTAEQVTELTKLIKYVTAKRRFTTSPRNDKVNLFGLRQPTPQEVKAARVNAMLTQEQASALVYTTNRTWHNWESGKVAVPLASWELFLIKLDQKENTHETA